MDEMKKTKQEPMTTGYVLAKDVAKYLRNIVDFLDKDAVSAGLRYTRHMAEMMEEKAREAQEKGANDDAKDWAKTTETGKH